MKEKRKYADRRQYLIKAVTKRRRRIKQLAVEIEYKGGKCRLCDYSKYARSLDLHHVGKKAFGLSEKSYSLSWIKIKEELARCILVCANCHREIEGGVTQLPKEILE